MQTNGGRAKPSGHLRTHRPQSARPRSKSQTIHTPSRPRSARALARPKSAIPEDDPKTDDNAPHCNKDQNSSITFKLRKYADMVRATRKMARKEGHEANALLPQHMHSTIAGRIKEKPTQRGLVEIVTDSFKPNVSRKPPPNPFQEAKLGAREAKRERSHQRSANTVS